MTSPNVCIEVKRVRHCRDAGTAVARAGTSCGGFWMNRVVISTVSRCASVPNSRWTRRRPASCGIFSSSSVKASRCCALLRNSIAAMWLHLDRPGIERHAAARSGSTPPSAAFSPIRSTRDTCGGTGASSFEIRKAESTSRVCDPRATTVITNIPALRIVTDEAFELVAAKRVQFVHSWRAICLHNARPRAARRS